MAWGKGYNKSSWKYLWGQKLLDVNNASNALSFEMPLVREVNYTIR